MGLSVALSTIGKLWQAVRTRFWDFMDRLARAQRNTPACRG
jgi:hypothetical protein